MQLAPKGRSGTGDERLQDRVRTSELAPFTVLQPLKFEIETRVYVGALSKMPANGNPDAIERTGDANSVN